MYNLLAMSCFWYAVDFRKSSSSLVYANLGLYFKQFGTLNSWLVAATKLSLYRLVLIIVYYVKFVFMYVLFIII